MKGHQGPVTSLHFHPDSDKWLLLSSSFDWTAKLWLPMQSLEPALTLENSFEYIEDSQWGPGTVLATANDAG